MRLSFRMFPRRSFQGCVQRQYGGEFRGSRSEGKAEVKYVGVRYQRLSFSLVPRHRYDSEVPKAIPKALWEEFRGWMRV
jgi:hypothetical protein|uniref:Uncharacterized protein n=1 Tax=Picea glauca TaxID=3330 RepID=A0A101M476_PICGL|nr:hypothetical protein ABT39_MTgene363 [Picea glauca]QHR86501.1 hypothetical protein Q903MT_gene503 [Picea sitchensis]